MELIINKPKKYIDRRFIYIYLPRYIKDVVSKVYNPMNAISLEKEFNIDCRDVVVNALNNLVVGEDSTSWTIRFDKNKKYKGKNYESMINLITYGSRTAKGYNILDDVFNMVARNIWSIYKEWLSKNGS